MMAGEVHLAGHLLWMPPARADVLCSVDLVMVFSAGRLNVCQFERRGLVISTSVVKPAIQHLVRIPSQVDGHWSAMSNCSDRVVRHAP